MISKLEEINSLLTKDCSICLEEYDNNNKKPMVMDCGHTICYTCLHSILRTSRKCPFDKKELKFYLQNYAVNWTYLEILNSFKKVHKPLTQYPNYKKLVFQDGEYEGQTEKFIQNKVNHFMRYGYGVMKYTDGSQYTGNWKNNQKSGYGKHIQPDNSHYEGEWNNDLPNGKGKFVFKSGEINSYDGSWRNGKFFGNGKILYSDGSELETIFVDGVPISDFVNVNDSEGNKVIGIAEQNIFKGKTYQITKNNDIYIGTLRLNQGIEDNFNRISLKNYNRDGYGVLHLSNGDVYEGHFENNEMTGEGKYIYKDGSHYQGEFFQGKRHGIGLMVYFFGDSYNGSWANDIRHGKGVYKSNNGESYNGQFTNDQKNGMGKLEKPDGYSYDGSWKNDLMDGQGLEILETKESYHGEFVKGKKNGKGLLVYANGDIYKGDFKDNKMHGNGVLITYQGVEISGKWSNGMLVDEKKQEKDKNCLIF